jgi:hypothetical protein
MVIQKGLEDPRMMQKAARKSPPVLDDGRQTWNSSDSQKDQGATQGQGEEKEPAQSHGTTAESLQPALGEVALRREEAGEGMCRERGEEEHRLGQAREGKSLARGGEGARRV